MAGSLPVCSQHDLSGTFGAMGAEADAKAYEFIIPDVDIEYLSSADIQDMPLQVVCYAKTKSMPVMDGCSSPRS